ncbi:hypothetical protein NHP190012_11230 [Helicobacter sp. NHP19-012]|uniref:Uncharacterized protein n=1 Tax=Helicobacter gastrofelis TaxID=2849642 RepID=A0ABN6I7B7_9HELI|nr:MULTISPECIES: hypothetical protein [unclassified Helicobacter]BCZ19481.1 hypothetical protein NHP190012_11230 [Helicobacter sp. NHP19-012]GMB96468.1 hypothetical protein NHP22001_10570 [Helicobacter sp. NHP22-001]
MLKTIESQKTTLDTQNTALEERNKQVSDQAEEIERLNRALAGALANKSQESVQIKADAPTMIIQASTPADNNMEVSKNIDNKGEASINAKHSAVFSMPLETAQNGAKSAQELVEIAPKDTSSAQEPVETPLKAQKRP